MHTYIKECETAILQIYKGLEYYKDLLDNCFSTEVLTIPIDTPDEEIDRITEKWTEDNLLFDSRRYTKSGKPYQ